MFANPPEREKRGGIYVIRNLVTQKEYVGSAVCIAKRVKEHLRDLRGARHHSVKLQHSWNKHGAAAFEFAVLAIVEDPTALVAREQEWLDALDTVEHGYNIAPTAGSKLGCKHTPETRQRISEVQRGKTLSAEHRAAMSEARKGKPCGPFSLEHRAAMSEARKGKPLSAERRARMSAAHKGKPLSAEHRAAISAANLGKTRPPLSPEHRAKISAAQKGKPWSAARAAARA